MPFSRATDAPGSPLSYDRRMRIHRLYPDASGESHFEDVEIPCTEATRGGRLSARLPAVGVMFREVPPDDEVILVEDTWGKGHRSRALDGKLRHCIFIPLE